MAHKELYWFCTAEGSLAKLPSAPLSWENTPVSPSLAARDPGTQVFGQAVLIEFVSSAVPPSSVGGSESTNHSPSHRIIGKRPLLPHTENGVPRWFSPPRSEAQVLHRFISGSETVASDRVLATAAFRFPAENTLRTPSELSGWRKHGLVPVLRGMNVLPEFCFCSLCLTACRLGLDLKLF